MATGNEYRKVRSLLAKTVKAGCTEGEAVSALETAWRLIVKFGLDEAKLAITVPEGYRRVGNNIVKDKYDPYEARNPAADEYRDAAMVKRAEREGAKAKRNKAPKAATKGKRTSKPAEPKGPSKKARVIEWLRRPEGLTIQQIVEAFGVQPHSARAQVSVYGREIGGTNYDTTTKVYRAKVAA
jgi:hypothetical protein